MDKRFCLVFIINFFCVYAEIMITELRGPNSVEYGSSEDVILDCDYDFDAVDEKELEIKWYYNGDRQVIYQWVPDSNKSGYAMGSLKDHIDVDYIATNDSKTMYRALRIFNVTTELSGNYTCKVSSFLDEDTETKQLTVYIPSKSGLEVTLMEKDKKVICTVAGVYPKPELNLYLLVEGDNKTDISDFTEDNSVEYDLDENELLYNASGIYFFPNLTNFGRNTKFVCELSIPGTDYLVAKPVIYQGVEVEYDIDEEEYIWKLSDNITSTEEYSNTTTSTNSTEDNSAAMYSPGVRLATTLALMLLLLCK